MLRPLALPPAKRSQGGNDSYLKDMCGIPVGVHPWNQTPGPIAIRISIGMSTRLVWSTAGYMASENAAQPSTKLVRASCSIASSSAACSNSG